MERFRSLRKGALGALMDLYEEEAALFIDTIENKVDPILWLNVFDKNTEDPDCRSIQSVCVHMISAAYYYVELVKQAESGNDAIPKHKIVLPQKSDFKPAFREVLKYQSDHFEGRWELSDAEIEKIVIKTGWGNVLDPESLLEHAVLHVMRHHRQVLRWLKEEA